MTCYRNGGCGPFEMYSCNVCPASKPEYLQREQPKPKTRADQIRAMSDEELANLFQEYACPEDLGGENQCEETSLELFDVSKCIKCWLDWLRQEVEADAKLD